MPGGRRGPRKEGEAFFRKGNGVCRRTNVPFAGSAESSRAKSFAESAPVSRHVPSKRKARSSSAHSTLGTSPLLSREWRLRLARISLAPAPFGRAKPSLVPLPASPRGGIETHDRFPLRDSGRPSTPSHWRSVKRRGISPERVFPEGPIGPVGVGPGAGRCRSRGWGNRCRATATVAQQSSSGTVSQAKLRRKLPG